MTPATEADARRRGLWAISRPVAQVTVAGQPAAKYIYDHYDGPVYDHFVAYVLPHRDKVLAIGFYTDQDAVNGVQQHMLDTVQTK